MRGVIAFLALVLAASIAIAVVLPRSSAAPLISAFIPIAVLILIDQYRVGQRSGAGLNTEAVVPSRGGEGVLPKRRKGQEG